MQCCCCTAAVQYKAAHSQQAQDGSKTVAWACPCCAAGSPLGFACSLAAPASCNPKNRRQVVVAWLVCALLPCCTDLCPWCFLYCGLFFHDDTCVDQAVLLTVHRRIFHWESNQPRLTVKRCYARCNLCMYLCVFVLVRDETIRLWTPKNSAICRTARELLTEQQPWR